MASRDFELFLVASFVLLVMPGPSVLYIAARSIDQGRIAGLVSVFATALGTLILVMGSGLGLSAILASSKTAFDIVKYLGAGYLVYLGISELRSKAGTTHVVLRHKKLLQVFTQGLLVAVLNPKTVIFFFAFIPQFVKPSYGLIRIQTVLFGLSLVALGIFTDSIYALLAGTVGDWLHKRSVFQRSQRYISTLIYLILGALAVFPDSAWH